MNNLITSILPEAITKHFGYETEGERIDRLVTESIMSGPGKVYGKKEWAALESRLLKKLDEVNSR